MERTRPARVQYNLGGVFEVLKWADISALLQGTYSQSMTDTLTYTLDILEGTTARLVYIPYMHHVTGLWTNIYTEPTHGPHSALAYQQWVSLFAPMEGGQWALQHE